MSSIFVQISSYHDYELSKTIKSAISESSGNNVINFGIHSIYYEKNDIDIPKLKNLKFEISRAPNNLGMGKGRLIAHQFYSGEDYYVQVDAHTMFDKNWDEIFINDIKQYKSLGFEKPLLTSYPRNYWYQDGVRHFDENFENNVTCISFHENPQSFADARIPSQTAITNKDKNIFSKSVSGGAIFTVGEFIKPNPKIFANGEEIFIAARAWTNGYDLLLPSRHVIYHLYYNHLDKDINNRRLVWNDYSDFQNELNVISKKEIYDMFTQNIIGEYNLGNIRSLNDFSTYSGLNFKNGTIIDSCLYHL
jgi:hypothetical protein